MEPVQTGMFPQSQVDKTQFAIPTQIPVSREIVNSDFDTEVNEYNGDMPRFADGGKIGLKALAQDLSQYGRGGDTMVAHINPQEAAMLKAMGGSGTINPTTGLPEFIGGWVGKQLGNIPGVQQVSDVATQVFQPAEKAIIQPASAGLAAIDKAVGNTIPGGWGTVGMAAGAAMGLPTWAMTGLGALNGSGVLRPGRGFNMQGALMGGAMAYGMSELGNYVRAADLSSAVPAPNVNVPSVSPPSVGDFAGSLSDPTAGMAQAYVPPPPPSIGQNIMSGNFGQAATQVGNNISTGVQNAYDAATNPDTYTNYAKDRLADTQKTFSGIGDLLTNNKLATAQADVLVKAGDIARPINAGLGVVGGATGLAQVDDQYNYNKSVNDVNNQANAEYNAYLAAITADQERAYDVMKKNPYQFAAGGMMPRFLSGGGDGLSDDIDATIGENQPAKLADGEFVVSADVVSGLGGGSSKAGAKKLYEMMDRVRQQAHGTKKQVRKVSKTALPA